MGSASSSSRLTPRRMGSTRSTYEVSAPRLGVPRSDEPPQPTIGRAAATITTEAIERRPGMGGELGVPQEFRDVDLVLGDLQRGALAVVEGDVPVPAAG